MAEEKCISRAEARRLLVEEYGYKPQRIGNWGKLEKIGIEDGGPVALVFSGYGDSATDPRQLGLLLLASDTSYIESAMSTADERRLTFREEMGWLVHNCVAHPVFGVLQFLGIYRLGRWIHDRLTPTS